MRQGAGRQTAALKNALRDPVGFCAAGSGMHLRRYQQAPLRAIVEAVRRGSGHSFVVLFPRQSGKNELQAQLEAYLLLTLSLRESEIVKVSPTWKPQSLNAMRRLERVLEQNCFTQGRWRKENGYIYRLGRARVFFLSGQPQANIVGATASTLLEVDEAQDVPVEKFEKEIAPMAASTNAVRVFWGTAWTSATLLARELRAAQAAEDRDGIRRVFRIDADGVSAEVPAYGRFVAAQVAKLGRQHPLVKTQFYAEELSGEDGMFPPQRTSLMRGTHRPEGTPAPGALYAFLIDFGGADNTGSPVAEQSRSDIIAEQTPFGSRDDLPSAPLGERDHGNAALQRSLSAAEATSNHDHDATALTIVRVDRDGIEAGLLPLPRYAVVRRQAWIGTPYTTLYSALRALVDRWQPRRIVTDATGLGAPLSGFLERAYPGRVLPFVFTSASKSQLGWDFLALVEGGRWQEPITEDDPPQGAAQAEFYRQLSFTQMEPRPGEGRSLRWGVPDGTRDAASGDRIHDDWVLSAALAARLDRFDWQVSPAQPALVRAHDPLDALDRGF